MGRSLFIAAVVVLMLLALPGVAAFVADLAGYGSELNLWAEERFGISHRLALGVPPAIVLFCVPILIVLLYFLRLKRKPLAVPSTFLWKKSVEDLHVNRLMQWMRRNVLLLLQLLAVLFLIYAVLGPRTIGALAGGRPYILMIDHSISMSATDVAPTRLDWAKAEAIKIIDAASPGDPGMVIAFHSTAEIKQSYTLNKEELKAAVLAIEPTQLTTRIDEALALAASRANPTKATQDAAVAPANPEPGKERTYFSPDGVEADIYLLSDGRFPAVNDFALQNLSIKYPEMPTPTADGTSNNLALVGFDAQRDPDLGGRVYVSATVANYRAAAATLAVRLDLQDATGTVLKSYSSGSLTIPGKPPESSEPEPVGKAAKPGVEARPINVARVPFVVSELRESNDQRLVATIEHNGDDLPPDDTASIVFGLSRQANVLVVTPGNRFLRNLFDLKTTQQAAKFTYLKPEDLKGGEYLGPARDGKFDLVVFDRCSPSSDDEMPQANSIFIGAPPPPYTAIGSAGPNAVKSAKGPIVRAPDARHPLMKDIRTLEELRIDEAFRLPFLPPRTPRLIEADGDLPLLVAIARQSFVDVVMTFPLCTANAEEPDGLVNSTWPLLPSYVVFWRNVLYRLGNVREAGVEEALKPGQLIALRPGAEKELRIRKPGTQAPAILERGKRPDVIYGGTDRLGVYLAEWGSGNAEQSRTFAVNLLDAEESNLSPVSQFRVGSVEVNAGDARKVPLELWKFAIGIALAAVLVEWWIYNKRVQI